MRKSFLCCGLIVISFLVVQGCISGGSYHSQGFEGTEYEDLCDAVLAEDTVLIEELLEESKLDVNYKNPEYGETLLHLAVISNKMISVKKLIALGADVGVVDKEGMSPMVEAVSSWYHEECHPEMLELLIEEGADVNEVYHYNGSGPHWESTPLEQSINGFSCIEHTKTLVENGAIIVHDSVYDYGAITKSIIQDRMDITKYLIIDCKAQIPKYCLVREAVNVGDVNDSLTVLECLMEEDYSENLSTDAAQKAKLHKEIVGYLRSHGYK